METDKIWKTLKETLNEVVVACRIYVDWVILNNLLIKSRRITIMETDNEEGYVEIEAEKSTEPQEDEFGLGVPEINFSELKFDEMRF